MSTAAAPYASLKQKNTPEPLGDAAKNCMRADASRKMEDGRDNILNNAGRTADRWWDYYDGKKTVAKTASGLAIGATVAGVGVATHGAAIPIAAIVGIAGGGFILGKMSDTAFVKLWGRQYTGGKRTDRWLTDQLNGPQEHRDNAELLEVRAHKTVRRAVYHFCTANEKFKKAQTLLRQLNASIQSCDDAAKVMTALLHVRHHVEKARLYLYPAAFLSEVLLTGYEVLWNRWEDQDTKQLERVRHPGEACKSHKCYKDSTAGGVPGMHWPRYNLQREKAKVADTLNKLATKTMQLPQFGGLAPETKKLMIVAYMKYEENRDSFLIKGQHGVTNSWGRKTNSEKGAFIAKNSVSAAIAGGTAGVHVRLDEVLSGLAGLMDMGFNLLDLSVNEGVEGSGLPSGDAGKVGAKHGKHAQEGLRHAAVHLWEAVEVNTLIEKDHWNQQAGDLRALDGLFCEITTEWLRHVYKIEHHLVKTREELHKMNELIFELTDRTQKAIEKLDQASLAWANGIDKFMTRGNHSKCFDFCMGFVGQS
jgi:hypothetical protein